MQKQWTINRGRQQPNNKTLCSGVEFFFLHRTNEIQKVINVYNEKSLHPWYLCVLRGGGFTLLAHAISLPGFISSQTH